MCTTDITMFLYQMNFHQIFNHGYFFKGLYIYRQLLFYSDAFIKCFIFRKIHGNIIKLNWLRISRTNGKNDPNRTIINDMRLSGLMKVIIIILTLFLWNIAGSLMFNFSRFTGMFVLFSLNLSMTYSSFKKYIAIKKMETFTFSP